MATEAATPQTETHGVQEPAPSDAGANAPQKQTKRSWRRKYRKMRIQFDNTMNESNNLIAQEWRSMGTARRLQENNDQILEALLDFNEQPRANARLRFDLRQLSSADTAIPSLETGPDPEAIQLQLRELREELSSGKITAEEYAQKADQLHSSQAIQQTLRSLASLEARIPHTTPEDINGLTIDGIDLSEAAPGFMTSQHEDEFNQAFDEAIAEFEPSIQGGRPLKVASAPPPLSEKDLTVRNPDSVYNWLRKHQPQVFLQDKDAAHPEIVADKPASKSNGRKSKRESAVGGTPGPRDNEDEDSVAAETGKGRRKTTGGDDDTAYRPKGGNSRASKRKREDGDAPAARGGRKKSRASTGAV